MGREGKGWALVFSFQLGPSSPPSTPVTLSPVPHPAPGTLATFVHSTLPPPVASQTLRTLLEPNSHLEKSVPHSPACTPKVGGALPLP